MSNARAQERIQDKDLLGSLQVIRGLPGVTDIRPGPWEPNPRHRLPAGTVVPHHSTPIGLIVKGYTERPQRGYLPITLYVNREVTTPDAIGQKIEAFNREHAAQLRAERSAEAEVIAPSRWANRPRAEIDQRQTKKEEACPSPSASATIPLLRMKTLREDATSKIAPAAASVTTTPPPSMRSGSRRIIPTGMVDLQGAQKILGLGSKSGVSYHVKMGHLKPTIIGSRGLSHLYRIEDVEALKEVKKGPGAPPGGHAPRVLRTVEDKLDAMLTALSQIAIVQQKLLEKWA